MHSPTNASSNPDFTQQKHVGGIPQKHQISPKMRASDKHLISVIQNSASDTNSRGTSRSRSPRKPRPIDKQTGLKNSLENSKNLAFKVIDERPRLSLLSREERIREKLKFFNLEKESLELSKKRIELKVKLTSTRFGPLSSNLVARKGTENSAKPEMVNEFLEMMEIEAEFGNIFDSEHRRQLLDSRTNSLWFPFYEGFSRKKKGEQLM